MDVIKDERDQFETINGTTHYFIEFKGRRIACWTENKNGVGSCCYNTQLLDITALDEENLKLLEIWNQLSEEVRGEITNKHEVKKKRVHAKMAHARGKRKKKFNFDGLPEFLKCKCGREVKANYYYLQKKADAKKVPLQTLVDSYQCQTCNPTKGRPKKK